MPDPARKRSETYLGHEIKAIVSALGDVCAVTVRKPDGGTVAFSEHVDPAMRDDSQFDAPKGDNEYRPWLLQRGISRARGTIALGVLDSLNKERIDFPIGPLEEKSDDEIQWTILNALRNIKRLDPQRQTRVSFDPYGVCLIEGIRRDAFDYNESRLLDRGWVTEFAIGRDYYNHNVRISEPGLLALENLERTSASNKEPVGPPAVDGSEYFVAHEFSPKQIDDLRRAIDEALEGSGLTPYYADSELRRGHIFTDKILPKILQTRFGIYEISNPGKPNVFLELGAAIAADKPYVIICEVGTKVPADLAGLDRIEYESLRALTEQLKNKLGPLASPHPLT